MSSNYFDLNGDGKVSFTEEVLSQEMLIRDAKNAEHSDHLEESSGKSVISPNSLIEPTPEALDNEIEGHSFGKYCSLHTGRALGIFLGVFAIYALIADAASRGTSGYEATSIVSVFILGAGIFSIVGSMVLYDRKKKALSQQKAEQREKARREAGWYDKSDWMVYQMLEDKFYKRADYPRGYADYFRSNQTALWCYKEAWIAEREFKAGFRPYKATEPDWPFYPYDKHGFDPMKAFFERYEATVKEFNAKKELVDSIK